MRYRCINCGSSGKANGNEVLKRVCPKCRAERPEVIFIPERLGDEIMDFYGSDAWKIKDGYLSGYLMRFKGSRKMFPLTKEASEVSNDRAFISLLFFMQKSELSAKDIIDLLSVRIESLGYGEEIAIPLAKEFAIGFHLITPIDDEDLLEEYPETPNKPIELGKAKRLYKKGIESFGRCEWEEAFALLSKASELGHVPSYYFLGIMKLFKLVPRGEDETNYAYLEEGAKLGDLDCLVFLGYLAMGGQYGDKGEDFAFACFRRGERKKHPYALMGLGLLFDLGIYLEQDVEEAKSLYLESYALNNLDAGYLYASLLEFSKDPLKEIESEAIYSFLCRRGSPYALLRKESHREDKAISKSKKREDLVSFSSLKGMEKKRHKALNKAGFSILSYVCVALISRRDYYRYIEEEEAMLREKQGQSLNSLFFKERDRNNLRLSQLDLLGLKDMVKEQIE